jgi:hypothetical protein
MARRAGRPAGVAGAGGAVAGQEDDAKPYFPFFFFFFSFIFFLIGLTSGPFYPCQQAYFLFAHLHLGRTHQIWCQFALNLRSVRNANNYPENCGFLRLKRKVMIFQNLAFNVVVLY